MLSPHFKKLQTAYVFPIIERKLAELQEAHPNQRVINLGVGDISLPLSKTVADAICKATLEMAESPRGYGPCGGYPFLKEVICQNEYAPFGIEVDEIFISDGTNSDASSIQEIFADGATVLVSDPSYPVYRDANLIAGKTLLTLPLREEEGFIPNPPSERADLAYLCTPCNPTGVAMTRVDLARWIDWAKHNHSLLLIDNVYQAFATSSDTPASIYELEGAREVAIEMRSFSKWAGFTGLRCGYMVVPKALHVGGVHSLWTKRVDIKTNGIAYPIQCGAKATYLPQARKELATHLDTYQTSAALLRRALDQMGQVYCGGVDAPYIFWKTPDGVDSWEFFDTLFEKSKLIAIPGRGFGPSGEGFVRLSCFLSNQLAEEAAHALRSHFATI